MILAIVLIVLAIILGLGGFLLKAATWVIFIALVLLVAGVVVGALDRGRDRRQL